MLRLCCVYCTVRFFGLSHKLTAFSPLSHPTYDLHHFCFCVCLHHRHFSMLFSAFFMPASASAGGGGGGEASGGGEVDAEAKEEVKPTPTKVTPNDIPLTHSPMSHDIHLNDRSKNTPFLLFFPSTHRPSPLEHASTLSFHLSPSSFHHPSPPTSPPHPLSPCFSRLKRSHFSARRSRPTRGQGLVLALGRARKIRKLRQRWPCYRCGR